MDNDNVSGINDSLNAERVNDWNLSYLNNL